MPKSSRTSASQVNDYGPVEERREDFADHTIQSLTMRQDMDATPLFKDCLVTKAPMPLICVRCSRCSTFHCGMTKRYSKLETPSTLRLGTFRMSSEPGTEYLQFSPTEPLGDPRSEKSP